MRVIKRDGSYEEFSRNKVSRSMLMAFHAVQPDEIPDVSGLANEVLNNLQDQDNVVVNQIHVEVEAALIKVAPKVGRAYIEHRTRRDLDRENRLTPDNNALAEYIHRDKYSRYRKDLQRRESYLETVDRVEDMHLQKFEEFGGDFAKEIRDAFQFVRDKRVLPSMRSMQFAGRPIEKDNARLYNCAFTLIDRPQVFKELFHLLLCGSGVGFSVQYQHIEKLSRVNRIGREVVHHTIYDSIEGWADALGALIESYLHSADELTGKYIEFNYSDIRNEGEPLSTSGGKAPGHRGLKKCLESIRSRLNKAQDRHLRPIEIHDIICFAALAVLSGGIRRSSLMSIFSANDSEMMFCKTRDVFRYPYRNDPGLEPQRAMANNSAALLRSWPTEILKPTFERIIKISQTSFGDPGFFFTDNLDYGSNPCGEIGLHPVMGKETGFAFCNLTEINGSILDSLASFKECARAASFIGTLQACYSHFPYLNKISEKIAARDRLLGVGITGIMDNPNIALHPDYQEEASQVVIDENIRVSHFLGIRSGARNTTIKPSGTASLELGCIGSGIHPQHSRRYFRRITANVNEPVAVEFARVNPHMIEVKPDGDICLVFPIQVPDNAITVEKLPALDFLDHVFSTYENWVKPGTLREGQSPGLTHNVSCTVTVRDDEIDEVIRVVWNNRNKIAAMAFVPFALDKKVPFAPRERIGSEDEGRWNKLIRMYQPIDWDSFQEEEDTTDPKAVPACSSETCEVS